MAGNSFGRILRLTSYGESHGPGLGGVLQLVLAGFAGLRITPEGVTAAAHLPGEINSLKIKGLHSRGDRFDLEVGPDGVRRI